MLLNLKMKIKYSKIYQKISNQLYKILNNGYNLYYKLSRKKIIEHKDRYELQKLLDSPDIESKLLGVSLLIDYSSGTDLLKDCSFRMYTPAFYSKSHKKEYHTLGQLQLREDTKIQEVIDTLKEIYLDLDSNLSQSGKMLILQPYLSAIGYYFAYHPRIGSQVCNCPPIKYPNPYFGEQKLEIFGETIWSTCKTIPDWDWIRGGWRFTIPVKKYWKTHKKPKNQYDF